MQSIVKWGKATRKKAIIDDIVADERREQTKANKVSKRAVVQYGKNGQAIETQVDECIIIHVVDGRGRNCQEIHHEEQEEAGVKQR